MKDIFFLFDDSGVLCSPKDSSFFYYCGYMIIGKDNKSSLMRKYHCISNILKKNMRLKK